MKKNLVFGLISLFLVTSCSITSNLNKKTSRKIVGNWTISSIQSSDYKMSDAKTYAESLINKMSPESYYIFNPDGTYRMKYGNIEKIGNWTVIDTGKKIVRKQNSTIDTLNIASFEKTKLTLNGLKNNAFITIELKKTKL
jgi:hypothetical protein